MEFTEPLEAAVVKPAQVLETTTPKRVSLPSMLPRVVSTRPFCASTGGFIYIGVLGFWLMVKIDRFISEGGFLPDQGEVQALDAGADDFPPL